MLSSLYGALRPDSSLVVIDFERIPGASTQWVLDHVRAGKNAFIAEIEAAGLVFLEEISVNGLVENYMLRFQRPAQSDSMGSELNPKSQPVPSARRGN
jgi:hypothetical protein